MRCPTGKKTAMSWMLAGALFTTTGGVALAAAPPATATVAPAARSARAFARLSLPKRTLYEGESVPVTFQAYYREGTGVTLTGTPRPSAADFTLTMGDPSQGHATIAGETYLVVTWKGRLSPAKVGRYPLKLEVPSTLEWQDVVSHAAPSLGEDDSVLDPFRGFPDPFGQGDPSDAFAQMQKQMQQMMNHAFRDMEVGPVQKRDVVVESPGTEVTVLALPAGGRPATFAGAVGHFDLTATIDTSHVRVGEPVELTLLVRGQGNFDRVSIPGLPDSPDFKTYAPTVSSKEGSKTFVQAVVPRRAGRLQVPPVELAYFDPEAAKYMTARTDAISLDVAPGQALAAAVGGNVPEATTGPVLAPNADDEGHPVASLRPLAVRRTFWLAQIAPLTALAAGATLVVRRRRLAADPRRAQRRDARRALRQYRAEMDRAVGRGDAQAFFAAARGAIQQALGARWNLVPGAITPAEIERRVPGSDINTLRGVFEADAARFGVGVDESDLARWNVAVRREIARTEAT
jgi:hypothetical protein